MEKLATSTSTWRPPTKEEDEKEILYWASQLVKLKWWNIEKRQEIIKKIYYCDYRLRLNK